MINDGVQLQCGPKVISDRVAVEMAGYIAQNQTFGPVGAAVRYTNYTAYPSMTPGGCLEASLPHQALVFWHVANDRHQAMRASDAAQRHRLGAAELHASSAVPACADMTGVVPCGAGLENYTCVAYSLQSYATNPEGPASFFTADSLFVVTMQTEQYFQQVSSDLSQGCVALGCLHPALPSLGKRGLGMPAADCRIDSGLT